MTDDLRDLKNGNHHAIEAFYRQYSALVINWVIRLGGPWLDPQDVAQDVFEKALGRLSSLDDHGSAAAWLYGVTRRVVANARRRAAFRRFVGLGCYEIPDPETDGDQLLNRLHQRRRMQLLLEQLTALHREVIVLVDLEERTAPEVAKMLNISVGTVYSRLHHGRKKLRAVLEAEISDKADAAAVAAALRGTP
ncbi:MAG: RNA polymerase sigma factor [Proteobacteria bacterium]|nr:RNA polymerase sigma factor [Pseudomonadota bacterium]